MRVRPIGVICLVCLGCHTALLEPPVGPSAEQVPIARSHLSLAAARLGDGDERQASAHLDEFVRLYPEHRNARSLHAELLFKRGRRQEARVQFEQTVAAAQEDSPVNTRYLLHCHGRLLDLAEANADDYEAALQRGLGLFWLAEARAELGTPEAELPVEALLCKAAASLSAAHALRPDAARPCWYLHQVWRKLGQVQQAHRWLQVVSDSAAQLSFDLSAAEQRSFVMACQAENRVAFR